MTNQPSIDTKEKSRLSKEEWREYTKTVWAIANVKRNDHPAVFPEEIPFRLAKMFSFVGETVLDPFAGIGTTARAVMPIGRQSVCVDQNPAYVQTIERECRPLCSEHSLDSGALRAVHGDSRNLDFIENESVDLIVTSPPYWDKADYGASEDNLGATESYSSFLASVVPVFQECFRVLKPGRKVCIVTANVNQYTEHGLLTFPLATDFATLLRKTGFFMVNEIIWSKDGTGGRWGSHGSQRPIFGSYPYPPNLLFKNVHEYILVFAKPTDVKKRGPKVKIYRELTEDLEQVLFGKAPDEIHSH